MVWRGRPHLGEQEDFRIAPRLCDTGDPDLPNMLAHVTARSRADLLGSSSFRVRAICVPSSGTLVMETRPLRIGIVGLGQRRRLVPARISPVTGRLVRRGA